VVAEVKFEDYLKNDVRLDVSSLYIAEATDGRHRCHHYRASSLGIQRDDCRRLISERTFRPRASPSARGSNHTSSNIFHRVPGQSSLRALLRILSTRIAVR